MSQARDEADKLCMTFLMETDIPSKAIAKQCALICVDKMLKFDLRFFDIEFLKEVKQEINKL